MVDDSTDPIVHPSLMLFRYFDLIIKGLAHMHITEGLNLVFHAEFFNTLGHPQPDLRGRFHWHYGWSFEPQNQQYGLPL